MPDQEKDETGPQVTDAVSNSVTTSTTDEPNFDFSDPRDPFESINRPLWDFNRDTLDPYLILPVANAYEHVPSPIRRGLYNMTDNLNEPASFVNNILQLKMKDAFTTVGRFAINSTIGLLGFFDVADKWGIKEQKETFGETLAVYGMPAGPYVMLPAAGPTVLADRGGDFVDDFIWPAPVLSWQVSAARLLFRGLEQRIELKQLEPMLDNSLDEYSFVREAYFSYWRDKVYDGNPPVEEDTWEDEWNNDWESEWESSWPEETGSEPEETSSEGN
ncbi:VacJ family lipoprotein [Lysobacter sp. N42]|nr:VacJ family lipoprotein [Aliidiomarina sp. B3213]TCZ91764.1 VacJ family lipoprotein [Lysobacter sp. N42]